jgi:TfoX/Sxy family transcriptional regulator of competence genes
MAYDEKVADRLRAAFTRSLGPTDDIEERKMFGGIAELVNGHMCVGVLGSELVVRARQKDAESALSRPHVRPMDFTGRPMKGWLYVAPGGFATDADLDGWVQLALAFVREAGPKAAGPRKPMKRPAARRVKKG